MFRPSRAFRLRQQFPPPQRIARIPRTTVRRYTQAYNKHTGAPIATRIVRFRKQPFFTYKRMITLGIYGAAIYYSWKYLGGLLGNFVEIEVTQMTKEELEEQRNKEEKQVEEEGEGPFYAAEDSTFIPMTWSKKLPRQFYKGSDPEWQEFLKVARDKPRHAKIQNELVQLVFKGIQKHPGINMQIGKEAKVGKYWLEITFPDAPPQEYERSGIEIGEDFVAWSQQKVTQEQQWRINRALWPRAAFDGAWNAGLVLVGINYRRFKQWMLGESVDPFSPEERFKHAIEMMAKHQAAKEGKPLNSKRETDPAVPDAAAAGSGAGGSTDPNKPRLPFPLSLSLPSNIPRPPTAALGSTDIPIALHVFQANLSKSWNPKKMEPPRGAFVVQGLVEVRGQKGRILFDVQSAYDPKEGKFTKVDAGVRNVKRWNQAPRGGA